MPGLKPTITIVKKNPACRIIWQYSGRVLRRGSNYVILEAQFNHHDTPILDTLLKNNDRFIEIYYTDQWYSIYEVHDRDDNRIKGWYCNVGWPAIFETNDRLSYVDLALDMWVSPDGTQTVLDENEFAALDLDTQTRHQARVALGKLQRMFAENKNPDLS